jgi:hypothetical protein
MDKDAAVLARRFRTGLVAGQAMRKAPDKDDKTVPAVPAGAGGDGANGDHAVLDAHSPWLLRRCSGCGHTFRSGDRVRKTAGGGVVHDMPQLCEVAAGTGTFDECHADESPPDDSPAAESPAAESPAAESPTDESLGERGAFFAGIDRAGREHGDETAQRLVAGHWLLAPVQPGRPRHACPVCGHTFRPYDQVAICSCHSLEPDAPPPPKDCPVAVHCDAGHRLLCLDDWVRAHPDSASYPVGRLCS